MDYLQLLINGILMGAVYALIGQGFSLVWGVLNIINLAHGTFVMLGAYITYTLFNRMGVDPLLTIPVSAAVTFALGFALQKYILNLIVRAPLFMTLILTFGISLVLGNVATEIWTADFRTVAPPYASATINLGPLYLPVTKVIAFALAIATTLLLQYINRTRIGNAIRAVRMDLEAAELMGVNVGVTYSVAFGIGAALAAVSGSLISLIAPITTVMGHYYLGVAFVVCALGGLGNLRGALVGGLLLGVIETFAVATFGNTYQLTVTFSVLLLVLLVRPRGILGLEYYD